MCWIVASGERIRTCSQGLFIAQASTVKRSAITVEQQYRWHTTVDQAIQFLRENNTGLTPDGKSFGEVMRYFMFGGDETCFLASNGEVKIVGDKQKLKHEVQTAGSRTSITVYRCGSAAGEDGPTGFLPPGDCPLPLKPQHVPCLHSLQ